MKYCTSPLRHRVGQDRRTLVGREEGSRGEECSNIILSVLGNVRPRTYSGPLQRNTDRSGERELCVCGKEEVRKRGSVYLTERVTK